MRIKATAIPGSSSLRYLSSTGAACLLALILIWSGSPSGLAQNASQPGYPGFNPTVTPGIQPSVSSYTPDFMPRFSPDFWKAQSFMQGLQAGTVLTGVLQDKLSSKSSKVGEVFSIALLDGYSEAGKELLPRGTKIVGAVTQVISGRQSRNGQPGRIDISLQTLVLPDGRSTPIYAFIERNPNLEFQKDPSKVQKGPPLSGYGQSMKNSMAGFANSIGRRAVGMQLYYPGRVGLDPRELHAGADARLSIAGPGWPGPFRPDGVLPPRGSIHGQATGQPGGCAAGERAEPRIEVAVLTDLPGPGP